MSIRDWMQKQLVDRGLYDTEANEVIRFAIEDGALQGLKERVGDDIEGYPAQLLSVVSSSIMRSAHDWLKENKPLHWALPMFRDHTEDGDFREPA